MKKIYLATLFFCLMSVSLSAQVTTVASGFSFPYGLALDGNTLYVSNNTSGVISKFDITEMNPMVETVLIGQGDLGSLVINGTDLYYGNFDGSVRKIDISSSNPTPEVVFTGLTQAAGLFLDGNTLYIASESSGQIFRADITQPNTTPELIASGLSLPTGFVVQDEFLYVAEFGSGEISRFDLSIQNPPAVLFASGFTRPVGLTLNGNFIYVAEGTNGFGEGNKISKIDITSNSPVLEDVETGLSNPRYCAFDGIDLYIALAGNGTVVKRAINDISLASNLFVCTNGTADMLGGASPSGGVYSGDNVTDNGDGLTFTFDFATAGVGTHTYSYTINNNTVMGTLEVTTPPTATFTAPGPFNTNDGLQPLTQGMPMGGTYSGMGVVDNGDGTFSFDPMAVGEGTYAITYTFEDDNGCSDAATDDIVVEVAVPTTFELTIDTLCLPLPGDFATGLGGGMPEGGVYSGDGVMDDGNGMTFTFDPAAIVFSGFVTVTYTVNGQSATDDLASVDRSFSFSYNVNGQTIDWSGSTISSAPDVFFTINFGDGSPEETFTDFVFPSHTYEQAGTFEVCATQFVIEGCDSTFCQTVVIEPFLPGDVCGDATSIDSLFNRPQNVAYTSPLFTNVNYTTDDSDPDFGYECFGEPEGNGGAPSLERTRWFTFVGDGNMYYITTVECNATDYIDFGDTQIAIYTGECDALVANACNEDGPDAMAGGPFPAGLEFQTEEGVEYRMMIDGFGPNFPADGEFCIQVTNLSVTSVDDIFGTPYQVFPNPTKGALNITGITPDVVRIQDSYGKLIKTVQNNTNEFSIEDLPNGVYFIQVGLDGSWSTSRIVKTN